MTINKEIKLVKQLDELSKKDLQILAIYREMNAGSTLDPQTIKNDGVTEKNTLLYLNNFQSYLE